MLSSSGVVLFSAVDLAQAQAARSMRRGASLTDTASCRRPVATSLARTDYTSDSRTEYELVQDAASIPPMLQAEPSPPPCPRTINFRIQESDATKLVVSGRAILLGAILGVGLGFLISRVPLLKTHVSIWVALPGDLFVRALRCLVVPMVFTGITVAIADAVNKGKASVLGLRTLGLFGLSSGLSAALGLGVALLFQPLFVRVAPSASAPTSPALAFKCHNGLYLAMAGNGSVGCTSSSPSVFEIADVNHVMLSRGVLNSNDVTSMTTQLLRMFELLVTDNIFRAFADGTLLSVIMFALPLGVVVVRSHHDRSRGGVPPANPLLHLVRQTRNAFLVLVHALLRLTPVAIVFLIGGAIASLDANTATLHQALLVLAAYASGVAIHALLVLPLLLFVLTWTNPFAFMKHLLPSYTFAFGCASSMATLPIALADLQATRTTPNSLASLVMALGTTINMNAAGLYYPLMTVFLAATRSSGPVDLSSSQLIVLYCMSLLGAMGTAPIPNAGLVMLLTVWKTVLPHESVPPSFALVVAMDFLIDRISTALNVHGNVIVTRILAEYVDDVEDVEDPASSRVV
ncbi:hypothetical protein SPRG_08280 [Saprolegnia parasitica CBS 223.65]|uniref:Amino acid transporter n=1 Tax=Saprolegnia parasitica (strain CBS 223.65) TaxID=695850 RepID=A0A067CI32_SAPPC|nr:hypothetical protein SPRG_08280 [Saprolegnia parasitica CBS 223.65]KDO26477.1 hypothetical protein SPRG_08280 [Saprolegnia parasitica CBS 223.65]|eukprot:XP_012202912.1 hypothetical protein SPRG_08280 [Saprolegnia parasitica CBS 223.65]